MPPVRRQKHKEWLGFIEARRIKVHKSKLLIVIAAVGLCHAVQAQTAFNDLVFKAGHPSLQDWVLPERPSYPADNYPTAERIKLGKMLFFDPRLSRKGNISCGTCHNPSLGWSDGLGTAVGFDGQILPRATPPLWNVAYNQILMWDGRKRELEDQALGPMEAAVEMNMDFKATLEWLAENPEYVRLFEAAYPNEGVSRETMAKAIASFERTIISRDTPFDRWVRGDDNAMSARQLRGFKVFMDPAKGNCAVCHAPPNFTDDGFHNLGLASYGATKPDLGRFDIKPVALMKGAFKTPPLRGIADSAPYFHDGSAATLADVIDHYVKGGEVKDNLSPNMKSLKLSSKEKVDLLAFLQDALQPEPVENTVPNLP